MSLDKSEAWYVLTSKSRQDAYTEELLNNQGYITYRPLAMRECRRRGKLVKVTESLFPRYLFIKLDLVNDNWVPIRSTYGVSDFVRFGGLSLSVSGALIDELRQRERQFEGRAVDLDRFQVGELVRISSGPFEGLGAVFERYSGEERAILLMNVLNNQTKVAMSPVDMYQTA